MKRRCASSGGEYADAAKGEGERRLTRGARGAEKARSRRTELGTRGLDADESRRVEIDELPLARLHAHRVERLEVAVDAFAGDVQVLEARRQLVHRRGGLVDAHLLLQHDDGEVALGNQLPELVVLGHHRGPVRSLPRAMRLGHGVLGAVLLICDLLLLFRVHGPPVWGQLSAVVAHERREEGGDTNRKYQHAKDGKVAVPRVLGRLT